MPAPVRMTVFVHAIGEAEARSDTAPSNIDACVLGVAADAADFDVGGLRQGGIEAEDARVVAVGRRIELVANAVVERELGSRGPWSCA